MPGEGRGDSLAGMTLLRSRVGRGEPAGLGPSAMRDLLRHVSEALERGRELILCQVVETRGSTPQKAGRPDARRSRRRPGRHARRRLRRGRGQAEGDPPDRRPGRRAAHVRPRPRLRLGRRPDLRRQDGDPGRGAAGARAPRRTSGRYQSLLEAGRGMHRGGRRRSRAAAAGPRRGAASSSMPTGRAVAGWPTRTARAACATGRARSTERPRPAVRRGWPTCRPCRASAW